MLIPDWYSSPLCDRDKGADCMGEVWLLSPLGWGVCGVVAPSVLAVFVPVVFAAPLRLL